MPLITYNDGVPAAANNPSNDQPDMLSNTQNLKTIWDQDHITFDANNSGTHQKVTFYQNATPIVPAILTESQIYPAAGTESTSSMAKYVNLDGTYTLNCVKAFGSFASVASGAGTLINGMNIVSINRAGNVYTIVLSTNAVAGTNAVVFSKDQTNDTRVLGGMSGANTLSLNVPGSMANGDIISFLVLQV